MSLKPKCPACGRKLTVTGPFPSGTAVTCFWPACKGFEIVGSGDTAADALAHFMEQWEKEKRGK